MDHGPRQNGTIRSLTEHSKKLMEMFILYTQVCNIIFLLELQKCISQSIFKKNLLIGENLVNGSV